MLVDGLKLALAVWGATRDLLGSVPVATDERVAVTERTPAVLMVQTVAHAASEAHSLQERKSLRARAVGTKPQSGSFGVPAWKI
jgi:hypothetical protein